MIEFERAMDMWRQGYFTGMLRGAEATLTIEACLAVCIFVGYKMISKDKP